MMMKKDVIAGVDIGTTKVCFVIGEGYRGSGITITGLGVEPSRGIRRGMVVDLDLTVEAIARAGEIAGSQAGVEPIQVHAGISGNHVRGFNSRGIVQLPPGGSEVTRRDIRQVIEDARSVPFSEDRDLIHALPQEFVLDNQGGIKDPLGMFGSRLEAETHIVTAQMAAVENISKCVERAGYEVAEVVLQPLASAEAVLSEDEKRLGVVLIDIGGGTTDLIIYAGGAIRATRTLNLGAEQVTRDLAAALRVPFQEAEDLKRRYVRVPHTITRVEEDVRVTGAGGTESFSVAAADICEIAELRMEESLSILRRHLQETQLGPQLRAGAVLTGGGSLLGGLAQMAEAVLGMPARLGIPRCDLEGLENIADSPALAAGTGLVLWGGMQEEASVGLENGNFWEETRLRFQDWLTQRSWTWLGH